MQTAYIFKHKNAFTVVEILITIAIVAILASTLGAVYLNVTKDARLTSMRSDLKNASDVVQLAYLDNGSFPSNESQIEGGLPT